MPAAASSIQPARRAGRSSATVVSWGMLSVYATGVRGPMAAMSRFATVPRMCGRYTQTHSLQELSKRFRFLAPDLPELELLPRYNIAPTQDAPVVAAPEGGGSSP